MSSVALWRVATEDGPRFARGPVDSGPNELLAMEASLLDLMSDFAVFDQVPGWGAPPLEAQVLCPLDLQPVWASGVTFERSRSARMAESDASADIYERVYDADRPELFLKALPGKSRGPDMEVTIRADSEWDVPEPELGVVADNCGRAVGYVLGNDMSSRSIEGDNPLYLPQAKVWEGSCAIGPCIVPIDVAPPLVEIAITLTVRRGRTSVFTDKVELARMHRTVDDLLHWLFRANRHPDGVVLLTGTSIVPGDDFTLHTGDDIEITATGLGGLTNRVQILTTKPS